MSRPKEIRKKVDVARPAAPLLSNPFAVLGEVEALKNLTPPEPEKPAPVAAPPRPEKPPKPGIPRNSRGRLVLRREKKDRGGKVVVVVSDSRNCPVRTR